MGKKEQKIELKLFSKSYKMVVPAEQESVFRNSGKLLEERVLYMEKNFKVESREQALIMVSIEMLAELMWEAKQEKDMKKRIERKIENMREMIVNIDNV